MPHERAQEWRKLSEPAIDPASWRVLLEGTAHAMGGDTSVVNVSHVMRLAGSIAWPMKEGRTVEITSIAPPEEGRQASYTFEHLAMVFPPVHGAKQDDGIKRSTNILGFADKVEDGRERYMLRTIAACLIQFIGEKGRAPTAAELADVSWPQYQRNVDFSRPRRRFDEFATKCAYTMARFHAGQIRGCETIEKTAELYRQRQQARAGQERAAEPPPQQGNAPRAPSIPWTSGPSSILRPCRAACCRQQSRTSRSTGAG